MFEYAAQFIRLGDELFEYYDTIAFGTILATWSGDDNGAQRKAIEVLEPLRRLAIDPTQPTGTTPRSPAPAGCCGTSASPSTGTSSSCNRSARRSTRTR